MTKYVAIDPATEVMGRACLAFVQNINMQNILPVLKRHGMEHIDAEAWYPMQGVLDIFREIQETDISHMFDVVAIGMAVAEVSRVGDLGEDLISLPKILRYMRVAYNRIHRNGNPGEYEITYIGDREIGVIDKTPYPHDFSYGMIYGFTRRWYFNGRPMVQRSLDACSEYACRYTITW